MGNYDFIRSRLGNYYTGTDKDYKIDFVKPIGVTLPGKRKKFYSAEKPISSLLVSTFMDHSDRKFRCNSLSVLRATLTGVSYILYYGGNSRYFHGRAELGKIDLLEAFYPLRHSSQLFNPNNGQTSQYSNTRVMGVDYIDLSIMKI